MNDIQRSKPLRFDCINGVNIYICYSYPELLKDLTLVEEDVIAWTHPIISIIKLRLSGISISAFYSRIHSLIIVFP